MPSSKPSKTKKQQIVPRGGCKCGQRSRPWQRFCWKCHAAYMRNYRKTHRLIGLARKKANARAYLKTYVKRFVVKPKPCEVCGNPEVQAHHLNYRYPLKVRWLCTTHHLELHGKNSHKPTVNVRRSVNS
jgi:ribosomal protein S27AE